MDPDPGSLPMGSLPLLPRKAGRIGDSRFPFAVADGRVTCFHNIQPLDFHDGADRGAMPLCAARLAGSGVRRTHVQAAPGTAARH